MRTIKRMEYSFGEFDMSRKYKHTVIASGHTLDFKFPKSWQELNQRQLKAVLVFLTAYDSITALLRITLYFANMVIVKTEGGYAKCRIQTSVGAINCTLSSEDMLALTEAMQWVMEPGVHPVLLDELGGRKSINKLLHGVSFENYLMLDNLYQGYLMSKKTEAILDMANLIYSQPVARKDWPDDSDDAVLSRIDKLKPYELFAIFQWYTQLKTHFSMKFSNFFKRTEGGSSPSVVEAMNAQIRALTGGDVTKEKEILAIDTWRALTELDAKAREAEEFKKSMKR